jgi:hypothetical protein
MKKTTFGQFAKKVNQIANNAAALDAKTDKDGKLTVPLSELLSDGFIKLHSTSNNLAEVLAHCGVQSVDDLIDTEKQVRVAQELGFASFDELRVSAAEFYLSGQLGVKVTRKPTKEA